MMTTHAKNRCQQRCIPPIIHKWLNEYGEERYDGNGCIKVFFSLKSKKDMARRLGRHFINENKKYLGVYRIENSATGLIITYGWKTKRFNK